MAGIDNVTWQALGLVLTLLGLGASVVVWRRHGAPRGLRWTAWSLLPLAAGLTGTLRLAGEVTDAVARWATRLVFSPLVWVGIVVAALAAALFLLSGYLLRRQSGETGGDQGPRAAVTEGRSTRRPPQGKAEPAIDDLDDIEAILRKHGIS